MNLFARDFLAAPPRRLVRSTRALGTLVSLLTLNTLACGPELGTRRDSGSTGGEGGAGSTGGDTGTGAGASGDSGGSGGDTGGSGGDVAGSGGAAGGVAATGGTGGATGGTGLAVDAGTGARDGGTDVQPPTPLKSAAARTGRMIGAALSANHLSDLLYASTAANHLNSATPENEMKWDATEPTRNVFTFERGDAIVAFAAQHGMQVRGHTLVWHSQLPSWVSSIQDTADMRTAMINHITQVALHYRGKVVAWDVVNEAVADGGQTLRATPFAQWIGARYIDDAFIAARAADPDARLYYNDYGAEGRNGKSDYVYTMVQGMLARGVPIDGVGLQMHTEWPTPHPRRPMSRSTCSAWRLSASTSSSARWTSRFAEATWTPKAGGFTTSSHVVWPNPAARRSPFGACPTNTPGETGNPAPHLGRCCSTTITQQSPHTSV